MPVTAATLASLAGLRLVRSDLQKVQREVAAARRALPRAEASEASQAALPRP